MWRRCGSIGYGRRRTDSRRGRCGRIQPAREVPLDDHNVRRQFRAITEAAGLGRTWVPRELRHTFVSLPVSSWCAGGGDRAVGGIQPDGHNGTGLPASDRARANSRRRGHGSDLRLADRPLGLIAPGSLTASAHAAACRDTQRLPCSFVHRSGRKSDRRIRRASTAWQFARRRARIVRFCPARLLAALTPAQANLVGDSTFFRLRMGLQGRWPNARGGRSWHGARGRSSLGPVVKPGCAFRCRSGSRSRW